MSEVKGPPTKKPRDEKYEFTKHIPVPDRTFMLDKQLIKEYLDAICDKTPTSAMQQRAAKAIIDNTQVVSFTTFTDELGKAIAKLYSDEPKLRDGALWMPMPIGVYFDRNKKSGSWVTKLALEIFPALNRGFAPLIDYEDLKLGLHPSYFIFFDDGIYSGEQMSENVEDFISLIPELGINPQDINIMIVTAYASEAGMQLIQEDIKQALAKVLPEEDVPLVNIKFFYGSLLRPLRESIADQPDLIMDIQLQFGSVDRYPYIFYHKMPDFMSSFPHVYSGFIPPLLDAKQIKSCPQRALPQIKPYLTGCVDELRESFWDTLVMKRGEGSFFQASEHPCPFPPYKR